MGLPSRSEYFRAVLLTMDSIARIPAFAFLEFLRPFDVFGSCSDQLSTVYLRVVLSSSPGLPLLALRRPRCFSHPRRFAPHAAFPALFHASTVHGLSSLRRFLPIRSPGSLSARSVLRVVVRLAPDRLRGFRHRLDALRPLRMVSADGPRSFPGRFSPSRSRPYRSRSALPRRSSPGLL